MINIILKISLENSDNFFLYICTCTLYKIECQISRSPWTLNRLNEGRVPTPTTLGHSLEYSNSITSLSVSFISSVLICEKHNQTFR